MKYADMIRAAFFAEEEVGVPGIGIHNVAEGYKVFDLATDNRIRCLEYYYGDPYPEDLHSGFYIVFEDGTKQWKGLDDSVPLDVWAVTVTHVGTF